MQTVSKSHKAIPVAPLLPAEGFIRLKVVLSVFPVSRSAWYAGVRDGIYPPPIRLGARTAAYSVASIRTLIESRSHVEVARE